MAQKSRVKVGRGFIPQHETADLPPFRMVLNSPAARRKSNLAWPYQAVLATELRDGGLDVGVDSNH